jgi:hypothetical protein
MIPFGSPVCRVVSPTSLAGWPASFAEPQGMRFGPDGWGLMATA